MEKLYIFNSTSWLLKRVLHLRGLWVPGYYVAGPALELGWKERLSEFSIFHFELEVLERSFFLVFLSLVVVVRLFFKCESDHIPLLLKPYNSFWSPEGPSLNSVTTVVRFAKSGHWALSTPFDVCCSWLSPLQSSFFQFFTAPPFPPSSRLWAGSLPTGNFISCIHLANSYSSVFISLMPSLGTKRDEGPLGTTRVSLYFSFIAYLWIFSYLFATFSTINITRAGVLLFCVDVTFNV